MEIIKEIQKHVTDNNIDFIEELSDIILEEKIDTLEKLKKHEIEYNNINEKNSYDMVINKYLKEFDGNLFEYEGLLYDEIQTLKQERKLIAMGGFENKAFHLIKYCKMTNRNNPFPYMTYKLIVNNNL